MTRQQGKKSADDSRLSGSLFGSESRNDNLEELRLRQAAAVTRRKRALIAFIVPVFIIAIAVFTIGYRAQKRRQAEALAMAQRGNDAPKKIEKPLSDTELAEAKKNDGWPVRREGNYTTGKIQIEVILQDEESLEEIAFVRVASRALDVKPSHIGLSVRFWSNKPDRDMDAELPPPKFAVNGKTTITYQINGQTNNIDLQDVKIKAECLYDMFNALHASLYPADTHPLKIAKPVVRVMDGAGPAVKKESLKLGMPEGFLKD